jgi:hypothetical protein
MPREMIERTFKEADRSPSDGQISWDEYREQDNRMRKQAGPHGGGDDRNWQGSGMT